MAKKFRDVFREILRGEGETDEHIDRMMKLMVTTEPGAQVVFDEEIPDEN